MTHIAVITGDIVASRKVGNREALLYELKSALKAVERAFSARYEIYRGDSFQVEVETAENAITAAIIIRAHLRSITESVKDVWDARVSVGFASQSEHQDSISESTGPAFELSGLALDQISKTKSRLVINASSNEVNEQLKELTMFADDVVSNWSPYSAEIAYWKLLEGLTQSELGKQLGRKQPTIHSRMETAKIKLIEAYIQRVQKVVLAWVNT